MTDRFVRPRLLDLFCGAGGCSEGYRRAGFDVVGVDLHPQPHYPFDFVQGDALEFLDRMIAGGTFEWKGQGLFDAVHASPPCQHYASITGVRGDRDDHADLIEPVRERLLAWGAKWREGQLPYVIENVPDARDKLREPTMLCGSAFGLPLKRHRYFESNVTLMSPGCAHGMHDPKRYRIRQHGKEMNTAFCYVFGGGQAGQPVATWREAMDIDWMTVDELSQAIPPAYTEHVGGYLLAACQAADGHSSRSISSITAAGFR
jgi:DNA (cytosine-5)-methyltransferase 1